MAKSNVYEMPRFHYSTRLLLLIFAIVGLGGGWIHDHRRLTRQKEEMALTSSQIQRSMEQEMDRRRQRWRDYAQSRFEIDEKRHGPLREHSSSNSILAELGVRVFVDQRHDVFLIEVPDTTNFDEAFQQFTSVPTLRYVRFVVGPLIEDGDWGSPEFRAEFGKACRELVVRTETISGHYEQEADAMIHRHLPHVVPLKWPGAF